MAELIFTRNLKHYLMECINDFFSEGLCNEYKIATEFQLPNKSRVDIAIFNTDDDGYLINNTPKTIIGLEIEVKSNQDQILRNYKKFKEYIFKSPTRKGGLIQIFSDRCDIYHHIQAEMLSTAYQDMAKNKGFIYDIYSFHIESLGHHSKTALEIVDCNDFWVRLNAMLHLLFHEQVK